MGLTAAFHDVGDLCREAREPLNRRSDESGRTRWRDGARRLLNRFKVVMN